MSPSRVLAVALFVFVAAIGCGMSSSSGTYTVSSEHDSFTQEEGGRRVEFRNWVLRVDDKEIPIEKKESVIKVETVSGKVTIHVNGELVHQD